MSTLLAIAVRVILCGLMRLHGMLQSYQSDTRRPRSTLPVVVRMNVYTCDEEVE